MSVPTNPATEIGKEIRESFELSYAANADDPACASDLSHFTNGWQACIMAQVDKPVVMKLEVDATAAIARINDEVARLSATAAAEPPGGTRWPVLRAMARNYTAGKHTWDALDADACEQAAEEIRHLRAALASAPVADGAKGQIEYLDMDNHRLRRALQKLMARLADLLDEDQFSNCESIVTAAGVEPPEGKPIVDELNSVKANASPVHPGFHSAPVAGEARPAGWRNALRIAELPEVDEALANFCDDSTKENAVSLVLAVLGAAPQASDTVGLLRKAAEALAGYRREMSLLRAEDTQPCDAERAIIAALKTQADKDGCTCPSGDGSLRHPYPAHPQTNEGRA